MPHSSRSSAIACLAAYWFSACIGGAPSTRSVRERSVPAVTTSPAKVSLQPVATDRALAVLLDRSAAMAGAKMDAALQATMALSDAMRANELIEVIAFDSHHETYLSLRPGDEHAKNREAIARIVASLDNGRDVYGALSSARFDLARLRESTNGTAKYALHVVFLCSGRISSYNLQQLGHELWLSEIRLQTLALGPSADIEALELLGPTPRVVSDPAELSAIFLKEVASLRAATALPLSNGVHP